MEEEKKFANEKLSDDELEKVAGGTWGQTADDSRFLNSLNGSTDRYGATKISLTPGTKIEEEVQRGWATVGIDFHWHGGAVSDNEYYLNGKKISQSEAREHAMQVTGRFIDRDRWDY